MAVVNNASSVCVNGSLSVLESIKFIKRKERGPQEKQNKQAQPTEVKDRYVQVPTQEESTEKKKPTEDYVK